MTVMKLARKLAIEADIPVIQANNFLKMMRMIGWNALLDAGSFKLPGIMTISRRRADGFVILNSRLRRRVKARPIKVRARLSHTMRDTLEMHFAAQNFIPIPLNGPPPQAAPAPDDVTLPLEQTLEQALEEAFEH